MKRVKQMENEKWVTAMDASATHMNRWRAKCVRFLLSANDTCTKVPNIDERLEELRELETLLGELWKRLEMDARKGDPTAPLRHTHALARRYCERMPLQWVFSTLIDQVEATDAAAIK